MNSDGIRFKTLVSPSGNTILWQLPFLLQDVIFWSYTAGEKN